ncbi:MAG: 2-phospho-L-lactate transferase [Anaerolineales bacterium]
MGVVALAGGVGGAKLADGLASVLPPGELTVIVNTGDDVEHFSLKICPDLDTVCYNLAGLYNPDTGWGRKDESWISTGEIALLGGPTWFQLGDKDFATHLERTRRLQTGEALSTITADFCRAWGVDSKVLPMSDDPIPTIVMTEEGEMAFQESFVLRRCEPRVTGFRFDNIMQARPAPGVLDAIEKSELVVICPSNPWVSIDPILGVPGIRNELQVAKVVAVSPLVRGKAVKGPAAKMFAELEVEPSALAVAHHYGALLDGFILDRIDKNLTKLLSLPYRITDTIMLEREHRQMLAEEVLSFGRDL